MKKGFLHKFVFCLSLLAVISPAFAASEKSVNSKLKKTLTIDYDQAELGDVLADIADISGVNIIIHPDVNKKQPVSIKLTKISAEKAFRWVLKLSKCCGYVMDEAVVITAKPLKRNTVVKVYPISDLISPAKSSYPPSDNDDEANDKDDEDQMSKAEKKKQLLEIIKKLIEAKKAAE